jgi:hypothetical protein
MATMILLYLIESSTLLNFHISSRIVTIYHFGRRNMLLLVFLMPYVFTHSPCYCDSMYDKYKELTDCQLHHIYHDFCANRSTDSNFKLRATSVHRQTDRQASMEAAGRDTDGQRSRQRDDP